MPKNDAALIFYIEFRNTLTRALGTDTRSKYRGTGFVEPTAGIWGNVRPERIGVIDSRKSWPVEWPILSVLTDGRGTRHKLTVVALYWAVKKVVLDLAATA
jgi:hypothetical protein